MVLDSEGNVLVTGNGQYAGADRGILVIKYSGAGIPLWTNLFAEPSSYEKFPLGIAVDDSDNVYVTGDATPNSVTLAYSSGGAPLWTNLLSGSVGRDIATYRDKVYTLHLIETGQVVTAHSASGVVLWAATNSAVSGVSIASDDNGNLFVSGDDTTNYNSILTVAYSDAGAPLWTNRFQSQWADAWAVTADAWGDVFVTGDSPGGMTTIAYSGTGVPLWTNFAGGGGFGWDVVADSGGRVYVTGLGGSSDFVTVAYSGEGVPLWTNRYYDPDYAYCIGGSIAVNPAGNVFVTGAGSHGTSTGDDLVTICYSAAGLALWTNVYNSPYDGNDGGVTIRLDQSGGVFVVGRSDSASTNVDLITLKYVVLPPGVEGVDRVSSVVPEAPTVGSATISFEGIPGNAYVVQRATDLAGPWLSLCTNVAGTNGQWQIIDPEARNAVGLYRAWVPW